MTRKQKRLLRNLIILVAALALILGGVKLYQRHKAAKEQADADARAQAGILTEQQAYTALQYWNGSTTLSFQTDEDGKWYWSDDPSFPLDDATVTGIVSQLASLTPQQTITDGDTLEAYGLDDPSATLTATGSDGSTLTLTFGKTTTDGQSYYMLMNGEESPVYIVAGDLRTAMNTTIYEMCQLPELPALTENVLQEVRLTAGDAVLELKATQGDNETAWSCDGTDVTDNETVTDIVSALKGLSVTACTDYKPSDDAAKICGFSAPAAEIQVTYLSDSGAAQTLELQIGAKTMDESGYYVRVNGEKAIYSMPSTALDTLIQAAGSRL